MIFLLVGLTDLRMVNQCALTLLYFAEKHGPVQQNVTVKLKLKTAVEFDYSDSVRRTDGRI